MFRQYFHQNVTSGDMYCNKCIMEFFIPFVLPDDDSGEACRCMHICQCHFLQLSRCGSPQAPPHQPIRGQLQCSVTNQRRLISPAWGLKLFTLDGQDTLREKAKVLTYLYPFTGKYIYKGTSLTAGKETCC